MLWQSAQNQQRSKRQNGKPKKTNWTMVKGIHTLFWFMPIETGGRSLTLSLRIQSQKIVPRVLRGNAKKGLDL